MIEQKFKKLTDLEHVLLRPGRYVGSINPHTAETSVLDNNKFTTSGLTWNPAFIKIFDEIISNSVDFSKTTEGKHLSMIKVNVDQSTGVISVTDNGGIVVVIHKEHNQYIPEMIFELKAGSNFDDDNVDQLNGQNGEGAALTAIFSKTFTVHTADGKKEFIQTHSENSQVKTGPIVTPSSKKFTTITYLADFARFNMDGIDEGNFKKIEKRVFDVAGCNPNLKVYFNDTRIDIKSFKDYIGMYTDEFMYDENKSWEVGVSKSNGSFSHVSFVNNNETIAGGTHVNYVADQIVNKLRAFILKKHKIDMKPTEIKNHLNLYINCNINQPRYASQTKESCITEVRNFGTSFDVTDKFIQAIVKSSIVQSILDWASAKEQALLNAELRKMNKAVDKLKPSRVEKFDDANEKKDRSKTILYISEGDSAKSTVVSARDPMLHGVFALKGKPMNVTDIDYKKLMDNEEFKNILTITGLQLGVPVTKDNPLRFGKICFLTDQDLDGVHIVGLLINMLHTFWPELFELGYVYRFVTPLIKVTVGKELLEFYDEPAFLAWKETNTKKFTSKYYKGLGTSTAKDFKGYLENASNLIPIVIEDESDKVSIKLAFSKNADSANLRKEWLNLVA